MRKPNRNPARPDATVTTVPFEPHEVGFLKRNARPLRSELGGYAKHENWLLDHLEPQTLSVKLDPVMLERTMRYARPGYGQGGPNSRIRAACIPALRRIGIDLAPEWRV